MNIVLDNYTPLISYLSPASIPQIVAHIQDYLLKHPILSVETVAEIIVQSLQEHPELLNGEAIPISADSEQSIKAYIDALPFLDTYTKAEINALLLGKQDTLTFDQAPTPGSSNPVTSSGIIAALSALQTALETQIGLKADSASTYTKTQVDTLLEDKADADNVYSKNTIDAKLLEVDTELDNVNDALDEQSQQIENLGPVNNLTSDSTTAALAAAQGKALKQQIDDVLDLETATFTIGNGIVVNLLKFKNGIVVANCYSFATWQHGEIGTIPLGFRPSNPVACPCDARDSLEGHYVCEVLFSNNGNAYFYVNGGALANPPTGPVIFNMVYPSN